MPDRKVRLIIEVDDKDVKATEASLNRLGVAAKRVGTDGVSGIAQAQTAAKGLAGEAENAARAMVNMASSAGGPLASALGTVATSGGTAGLVIAGFGLALTAVANVAFKLTQQFAEYGVETGRLTHLTGISAEAISGLRVQVESTGGSVGDLEQGFKRFEKTIGDAENGSKTATATLRRLGVDGKAASTDLEVGFRQALATIAKLPDGVGRTNALIDLFGEEIGPKLDPAFRNFHGNMDDLIKKADELGLKLSGDDVRQSEEFEVALKKVGMAATGVGVTFGRELAEPVTEALNSINSGLKNNKGVVEDWANWFAQQIRTLKLNIDKEFNDINAIGDLLGTLNPFSNDTWDGDLPKKLATRRAESERIENGLRDAQFKSVGRDPSGNPIVFDPLSMFAIVPKPGDIPALPSGDPYNRTGPGKEPKAAKTPKGPHEKAMKELGTMTNLRISTGNPQWDAWFEEMGHKFGVDPNVLLLQDHAESTFKSGAVSPKGAKGFAQFMPGTAKRFHVDTSSIKDSMRGQAEYMSQLLAMFGGDYGLALAAYNAGEGNVQKYHGIPPFKETRGYVAKITSAYHSKIGTGEGGAKFGTYDPEKRASEFSDQETKQAREKQIDGLYKVWLAMGLIPDSRMLSDFQKKLADEARKGLGPVKDHPFLQPTTGDVKGIFIDNAIMRGAGDASTAPFKPGQVQGRDPILNDSEQYIKNLRIQLGLEKDEEGNQTRVYQLLARKAVTELEIKARLEDQAQSRAETLHDLNIEMELLKRGNILEDAKVRARQDEVSLTREIRDLQIEIMNAGKNDQLEIEAAHLRDILELRHRERDAVISIQRSQLELSKAMEISNKQIRAGVYEHLAQQKTLNQGIVDGINGTYDAIVSRMDEPFDKLNAKSKGLLSFITEPLKAIQHQAVSKIFGGIVDSIFPDGPLKDALKSTGNPVLDEAKKQTHLLEQIRDGVGGGTGISGGGSGGGIGGIFKSIFGGGGNGSGNLGGNRSGNDGGGLSAGLLDEGKWQGGGGEEDGEGKQGGGMFGGIKGMFGAKKNLLTGKDSKAAGIMGGIGSLAAMAGSAIGGRAGRTLQYAGIGAQIGANFGPWGAAIGAGAGALIGFFTGKDDAEGKLKAAAASQFGIHVTDKSVIRALKSLGEGMFGKGKVGANATSVVRSEEGQNILRAYAEGSGQSGLKIDRLNYGDPNWSGNDFRSNFGGFRAMGGPVSAGRAYVVGERRPEVFVPHVNGTIMPAVPSMTTTSGVDKELIAGLAEAVYQLADEVRQFKTMPAGALVKQGLETHPEAAADAYERSLGDDPNRRINLARVRGEYS